MILSAHQLMASGWKKIDPRECCLCGYKPPSFVLTPQNDPRQLTMFCLWQAGQRAD